MENASAIKLVRKESVLLINNDANDFIYDEEGFVIGASKGINKVLY